MRTRERRAAYGGIAVNAVPQPEDAPNVSHGFATEARARGGVRELLRAQQIPDRVRPAELPRRRRLGQIGLHAIAAEHAGTSCIEPVGQHRRPARGGNRREDNRGRDQRPQPACRALGAMPRFVDVQDRLAGSAVASSVETGATAALASAQACCVLPTLIGLFTTPSNIRRTTCRRRWQTTVT